MNDSRDPLLAEAFRSWIWELAEEVDETTIFERLLYLW
jgi:hypothetical protein